MDKCRYSVLTTAVLVLSLSCQCLGPTDIRLDSSRISVLGPNALSYFVYIAKVLDLLSRVLK